MGGEFLFLSEHLVMAHQRRPGQPEEAPFSGTGSVSLSPQLPQRALSYRPMPPIEGPALRSGVQKAIGNGSSEAGIQAEVGPIVPLACICGEAGL